MRHFRPRASGAPVRGKAIGQGTTATQHRQETTLKPSKHSDNHKTMPASTIPACPQCGLENTYPDGDNFICPDCGHEWPAQAQAEEGDEASAAALDANGTPLADGDAVILVKDLKVKGSSVTLKKGTKIKSIRLVGGAGGHNVDCKTEHGSMMLKSEFLKKA